MNIKTQLLKYQEEMEDLEKKAQRITGALDVEYTKLREELNDTKITNENLIEQAKNIVQDLETGIKETERRLDALMEEIQDKYHDLGE